MIQLHLNLGGNVAIKNGLSSFLPEVGKIKIGCKGKQITSRNGNAFCPPKKLDYFMITTTERVDTNFMLDPIMKDLGQVKELKIKLPFDAVDKNFFTQYQRYTSRKRICSGDGEKAINDKGEEIACDPKTCQFLQGDRPTCKPCGILSCFLPQSKNMGGIYKFRTHSWNTVSGILGQLEYFHASTGGVLQGLPLLLKMIKKSTTEHGNVTIVTIVIDSEEIKNRTNLIDVQGMRILAMDERKNRAENNIDIKLIEAQAVEGGALDDKDEPEDVDAEFYYSESDEKIYKEQPITYENYVFSIGIYKGKNLISIDKAELGLFRDYMLGECKKRRKDPVGVAKEMINHINKYLEV